MKVSPRLAEELRRDGVGANTLWPVGLVTTSALNHMMGNDPLKIDQMMQVLSPVRHPSIHPSILPCNHRPSSIVPGRR
jgi:hypothetical protein